MLLIKTQNIQHMSISPNESFEQATPKVKAATPHLTYSFLKMFFQQERLPKEIHIPEKHMTVDPKRLSTFHINAIELLIKKGADLKKNRYAEVNKYWLELIYKNIINKSTEPIANTASKRYKNTFNGN